MNFILSHNFNTFKHTKDVIFSNIILNCGAVNIRFVSFHVEHVFTYNNPSLGGDKAKVKTSD
jgi:hypothetical protein